MPSPALSLAALLACCVPVLVAFNLPPSATFFNQAAALGLWGVFAALLGMPRARAGGRAAVALLGALALLVVSVLWSAVVALPASLAASALGLLLGALVMAWSGAALQGPARAVALQVFLLGWVVVGVLSSVIALVQVFAPGWADGVVMARSGLPGRAVGNLRQPNHLSTLLLWSLVALVPLREAGRFSIRSTALLGALMVVGVELSGSRTGTLGVLLLALWGVVDKRLSRPGRLLLLGAPLFYAAWAMALKTLQEGSALGAATRLGEADVSGSRFGIWRNTLEMIAQQPWTGVGFGEFNFAWTLTPFPGRPVAFFDHTHNVVLQFAVELGVPLALLVLALLGLALWQAWRRTWAVKGVAGTALRALFVMVLLVALHSQLEYPLWYAYFLLPAAWMWGVCLGTPSAVPLEAVAAPRRALASRLPGLLLAAGAVFSLMDYGRVVSIFSPGADAGPLAQRIEDGQHSVFFAHHADYAAATTADVPADALVAFERATHFLLDTRLMLAWAEALADAGDLDRARHVAQRLREFHYPQSEAFFAPCAANSVLKAADEKPFQCEAPEKALEWRDFLDVMP
ncbi:O-antigen ligase family protein [uncultured Azohydromonas sp.]|jgi:Lipid A core - O-antigen ligase and related enzymes|uniref:PglL family O-oligosaccharyltransferase n=1 Tax=uncultured Azohydromonas sp. TaxID=487342 RepID=UPI00261E0B76|nr:O-antigen ligase family protein [uncultured Azohydromonas sp.]